MYVEWLANSVSVIKKDGSLKVCIYFRDLNVATQKDEYSMSVEEILVDSAACFECLSRVDGYSGCNQIYIAEDDVPKWCFDVMGSNSSWPKKHLYNIPKGNELYVS